ncbi:MAG: T9SS type A sorting domain-containing protein [Bacteroidota bacterium]
MQSKLTMPIALMLMIISNVAVSQLDQDGKIRIEITKEIDGEKRTFKGEYNSTEEMNTDPNYQEFAGEDNDFDFWFDDAVTSDVFLHLDQLKGHHSSFFKFFDHEDEEGSNRLFFKHFDSDSVNGFFDMYLDDIDMEEYKEQLKNIGIELDDLLNKLKDGDSESYTRTITIKRIKISDVTDEFGKQGKVNESNLLELEDLTFYPNPSSNGRIKVRFSLPEEGELKIKVSNLEGKEVFSRYFGRFGGTYAETIDLSDQRDGIYLLEITQGKRRLTKKLVIE